MLITELKAREALNSLTDGKVFIINCHGCKEVYFAEHEADAFQKELQEAGKVTGILTTDYICNPENMALRLSYHMDAINAADAVLVFSCGVGVQTVAAHLANKKVYACCDTYALPGYQGVTPLEVDCKECGKRWNLNEDGTLTALEGETEFSHVPDWFNWEREQVKAQIARGEYSFSDEVDVYSMPRCWKFEKLGKAKLTHTIEGGFVLEGEYRGEKYHIHRTPLQTNSLHIEYDYCYLKPLDCVDISTENDSFYCYPETAKNVVTKLAFATEELYARAMAKKKEGAAL